MRRALFSRRWPHWSWFAGAACIALIGLIVAPDAVAQTLTLDIGEPGGSTTARLIQLVGVVTLLSIAPGILVTVTSFTRLVIVFSLLRTALGTQQSPPNIVIQTLLSSACCSALARLKMANLSTTTNDTVWLGT